jgi:hypothetical protein
MFTTIAQAAKRGALNTICNAICDAICLDRSGFDGQGFDAQRECDRHSPGYLRGALEGGFLAPLRAPFFPTRC